MRQIAKILSVLAVFGFIFYLPAELAGLPAHAQTISELKTQIDEKNKDIAKLEAEIKAYQGNIDEAETTAKTLQGEIKRLDNAIKQLNAQVSLTQQKIAKKELEIKGLDLDINDVSISILARKNELSKTIEILGKTELEDPISKFFKYQSISAFFSELEKIEALEKNITSVHDKLVGLKSDLETKKGAAEDAKQDLKKLKSDLLSQLELQKDGKAEKSNLLKVTKNQEVLYQKLLKEREQKRTAIYEEIRKIETELQKKIDLASLPQFGKGILGLPIDGGVITQGYGQTDFAKNTDVYKNGFHNGIDFRAAIGTPIKSADSGRVKSTGNSDLVCPRGSYGKWVLIEHPNKLTTLYAHLSLIRVDIGQTVQRGAIIGYSGNTGYTTGPHLHFVVYDARTVELRQSRVCGTLPYGGYLDPLNYL